MIHSALRTATDFQNLEFIIRLDEDDLKLESHYIHFAGKQVKLIIGSPTFPNMSTLWNECYRLSIGDIVFIGNDDIIFQTKGWDMIVREAFHDDPFRLVYGSDGIFNDRLATFPFLTRKWCDTLGYLTPPYEMTYFLDDWITAIAGRIDKKMYIPEITFKHGEGRGENPELQPRMVERHKFDNDFFFGQEAQGMIVAGAEKLREQICLYQS
jgi:hypothetical protein